MKVFYKQVQLNPTTETDYTDLVNKPSINGVELEGDLSTEQIKVTWHGTQEEFDALPSHDPYTFYIIDDGTSVGTQDSYLDLADKPSINGQILTGNKVSSDLNMYTSDEVDNIIASMRAIKVVTALPPAPQVNTMYYVGPDSEGVYQVYLYDSLLNRIDLGPSVQKLYTAGNAIGINETTSTISVKYDGTSIRTNTNNELYIPELMGSEGSGVNPIYLAGGELRASASTVGADNRPVYLDNGELKQVGQLGSGSWTGNAVPYHQGSTLEIGPNIDFHGATSTADFDTRLGFDTNSTTGLYVYRSGMANGYIPQTGQNNTVGSAIQPVYVNNGTITGGLSSYNAVNAVRIPNGADLNTDTYTVPGAYCAVGDNLTNSLINCPTGSGFRMDVMAPFGDDTTVIDTWYRYRVREITDWWGKKFIQYVYRAEGSNIIFGPGYQIIDSRYTEKFAPFCISHSGTGKVETKTFTDASGRTYTIWSTQGRAICIGGAGISDAVTVKLSATEQVGSAISGTIKLRNLAATQTVYIRAYGVSTGTTPMYFNVSGAATDGNYSFSPFGNVNFGGVYTLNIAWNRLGGGGNWGRGAGSISLPDTTTTNSRMCDIDIWCQAGAVDALPCLEFGSTNTTGDHTFTYEVYPKSW